MKGILFLTVCVVLSGCSRYYADPSCVGNTARCAGAMWEPSLTYPYLAEGGHRAPCDALVEPPEGPIGPADLIRIALCNNPATRETWALARAAHYNLGVAQSAFFPTLQLTESLTYTDVTNRGPTRLSVNPDNPSDIVNPGDVTQLEPGTSQQGVSQSWTQNLGFNFLLLDFGGRCADVEAAKQILFASNWQHNRTVQGVILEVLSGYYDYINAVGQREARESDVAEATTSRDAAKERFETGVGKRLDLLQAESDLLNAELTLVEAKGRVAVEMGRLATALGLPSTKELAIEGMPQELSIEPLRSSVDELVSMVEVQRPDLAAAFAGVCERKALVRSAFSASRPTLTTSVNLQQSNFFNRPELSGHVYSGSLSLNIPLFNGFLHMNQIRRAREEWRAATADFYAQRDQAQLDVVASYTDVETAVEAVTFTEAALETSNEAYAEALETYREGTGGILDLLAAQRGLAAARAQHIEARTRWAVALSQLGYAVGTLGVDCGAV